MESTIIVQIRYKGREYNQISCYYLVYILKGEKVSYMYNFLKRTHFTFHFLKDSLSFRDLSLWFSVVYC